VKRKHFILLTLVVLLALMLTSVAFAEGPSNSPHQQGDREGCVTCHEGIENIRQPDTLMYQQIQAMGECTACHGGDAAVTDDADAAHSGDFYPDPGSIWVSDKTCGKCHPGYTERLMTALMNTEMGKIQGNLVTWGAQKDRKPIYANYTLDDQDGLVPSAGTDVYKAYMKQVIAQYPDNFPTHVEQMPNPTVEEIVQDPSKAAFTYQRQQCQRCHVGVQPRTKRGDWRGAGCSSCHIPYSNEGFYEGDDPTIPKDEPGHLMTHQIQATRDAKVTVNGHTYSGIPVETCNSCHNRGKRIGVSYEGIMEFPYGTPFDETGMGQPKLHTKKYLYIKDDLHHSIESRPENPKGGMLCQDCHTSIEMHGDGNIPATTLAQVEIECADCHGTPDQFPWELPLGYGEELLSKPMEGERGLGDKQPDNKTYFGMEYDPMDGFLLTTRGNPFENVVKNGDEVIVHSASGLDFKVPLLKKIKQDGTWKTQDAEVAMDSVGAHLDKLECYSCHSDWAPQCYGCHVTMDYSEDKSDSDWIARGNAHQANGLNDMTIKSPGKAKEGRSYLRWENPILGINGEGRVTPLIPGCQVIYTVIGPDGKNIAHNVIASSEEAPLALDMAPVQPHTAGRKARTCESCHNDPKALGYGIGGGVYMQGYDKGFIVDLVDAEGNVLSTNARYQSEPVPGLTQDLSQIVDPETGEQLMVVGTHWPASGPLTADQRTRMERVGLCMGCHQNMADAAFWTDSVIAKYGKIGSNADHIAMLNQMVHDAVSAGDSEAAAKYEDAIKQLEAAQAAAKEAEAKASDAEAAAKEAEAKVQAAETEKKNLEAELEKAKAQANVEQAPAPAGGGSNWVAILIAALVGLIVGGGVAYVLKK